MFILPIFLLSLAFGQISCQLAGRIIGGNLAYPGQFPHQVSLQQYGQHFCGGSIISPYWILTAAHCAVDISPSQLRVVAGTTDLEAGDGKSFGVSQLVVYPKYRDGQHDWDLALVRLSSPIPLGGVIQKIELAPVDARYPENKIATVSGFGAINQRLDLSTKLQYANVPLLGHDTCSSYAPITDRMICAGHPHGQVSSCQGDSGGPLVVDGKLFGAVSWGFGCGQPGPAFYAYIAAFRSWVQYVTGV